MSAHKFCINTEYVSSSVYYVAANYIVCSDIYPTGIVFIRHTDQALVWSYSFLLNDANQITSKKKIVGWSTAAAQLSVISPLEKFIIIFQSA